MLGLLKPLKAAGLLGPPRLLRPFGLLGLLGQLGPLWLIELLEPLKPSIAVLARIV